MTAIFNFFAKFFRLFIWWVVIQPWEQAVRVRLGKHLTLLHGGLHFRIPWVDVLYRQSVRQRISQLPTQTLTSSDGKTLFIGGAIGYSIADVGLLYDTLHHAEDTLKNRAQAVIAQYVYTHKAEECQPNQVSDGAMTNLHLEEYGLGDVVVYLTEFALVPKTYRLIMNSDNYAHGSRLETDSGESGLERADESSIVIS